MSWTRPSCSPCAVPEVPLDLLEERGREPAEPLLRAELEDAVRLETRGLGLLPVAGGRRRLEAVERRRDDVEVGGLRRFLPRGRIERLRRVRARSSVVAPHVVCGSRPTSPWDASDSADPRSSSATPSRLVGRCVASSMSACSTSWNAAAAPSRNVTASWISNSSVTRPSFTPRPYSIGTRRRKRSSCPARRASSSSESGAARKPGERRLDAIHATASVFDPVAEADAMRSKSVVSRVVGRRAASARGRPARRILQ